MAKVDQDLRKKKNDFFSQAIRDGVIEAVLDHESGTMQSKDTSDVYSTRQAKITLKHDTKMKTREFKVTSFFTAESHRLPSTRGLSSASTCTTTLSRWKNIILELRVSGGNSWEHCFLLTRPTFQFSSFQAMRFPPKSYNKELESAEDRREREAQVFCHQMSYLNI